MSCNVAIMASSALSAWQHGLSVLNGQVADEISYTSCMNSCDRNHWPLALTFLGIVENSLRLNSISCNSAVNVCSTGDTWHLAWELFAWMGKSRIPTDTFTCSSLVSGLEHEWELALCALKDVEADEVVVNAAIDTTSFGGWTMGIQFLENMRRRMIESPASLKPSSAFSRQRSTNSQVTYTAVASACGAARWEFAEDLLAEMQSVKVGEQIQVI